MKSCVTTFSYALATLLVVSGYGTPRLVHAQSQSPSQPPAATQSQASTTPQTVQTKPSVQSPFSPPQPHTDAPPEPIKRYPGDGDGAYKTGIYRDLFAERGHSAAESRAKVDATFEQLFHGDKATQAIYYEVGSNANGPLAISSPISRTTTRAPKACLTE